MEGERGAKSGEAEEGEETEGWFPEPLDRPMPVESLGALRLTKELRNPFAKLAAFEVMRADDGAYESGGRGKVWFLGAKAGAREEVVVQAVGRKGSL